MIHELQRRETLPEQRRRIHARIKFRPPLAVRDGDRQHRTVHARKQDRVGPRHAHQ